MIAIEEKGYVVEYNRGPTSTFATSTDGNLINIKVNSICVRLYNSHRIEYAGKLELCCCGWCGGNLLTDCICPLCLQQQQTLLKEKPESGGGNSFAVFVDFCPCFAAAVVMLFMFNNSCFYSLLLFCCRLCCLCLQGFK